MRINLYCFYESRDKWMKVHSSLQIKEDLARFLEDEEDIGTIIKAVECDEITVKAYDINTADIQSLLSEIKTKENCMIWNLTDGATPYKGSNIPALAALFDIPYVGSNSYVQMLAQNKNHTRNVVSALGIKISRGINIHTEYMNNFVLPFDPPYFIKPTCYDNSIGDKVVYPVCWKQHEVYEKISHLRERGIEQVLVEEFLEGSEYSVAMVNTGRWVSRCFKIEYGQCEYWDSNHKDQGKYSISQKEGKIARQLIKDAVLLADNLHINDYFRADFRCNKLSEPCFLEINTTPFLICKAYTNMANSIFSSREDMLKQMILQSFNRQTVQ